MAIARQELEALYGRIERPLYNVVYRWVWDAEEAQDLVQEAFLRVWRRRDAVDPDRAEPYVYRAAVNLAANRHRSRKLWRWVGLDKMGAREETDAGALPLATIERREAAHRARAAIDALPERLRRVVLLCEYSDMTQPEIGQALGIPAGTVASRRNKALKVLRETLEKEVGHD